MVAKKYQNPKGGLNKAGRAYFKRKEGSNLKSPQKTGTGPRRVSFAASICLVQRTQRQKRQRY